MARYGLSDLPTFCRERDLYGLVDEGQRILASGTLDDGELRLDDVPLWTLQALTFLLFRHHRDVPLSASSFSTFASKCADQGSRLFADHSIWPACDSVLQALHDLIRGLTHVEFAVLIGRAMDYGRTLQWDCDDDVFARSRDLVVAKTQGIFYTPAFVARHIVRRCVIRKPKSAPLVCDPALGGGIFLIAAALRLIEWFDPIEVRRCLHGAETDPLAAEVASILIESVLGTWDGKGVPGILGTQVIVGDSFGGPVKAGRGSPLPGGIDWSRQFAFVFENREGFDLVLTNPPFGRYKVNSDWLVAKEMRLDPQSLRDMKVKGRTRSQSLRSSGWYELATVGVLDKSRLGLERAMQITAPGGFLGAIVPSTITADIHSTKLRRHLLAEWSVLEVDEFPETARLFYDVNLSTAILVARNSGRTGEIDVRSNVCSEDDLAREPDGSWTLDLIAATSPGWAIPVRAADAADILEVLHRHPRLEAHAGITNARGEVDLTTYADALTDDPRETPLVRGVQVDSYRRNLPNDKKAFVETDALMEKLGRSPKREHIESVRLAGRQCSYLYRPQRLSFAVVEAGSAVANSCNYIVARDESTLHYLLALLNSSVLNWRFAATNSNNHVANSELADLPVPDPSALPASALGDIIEASISLSRSFDAGLKAQVDQLVAEIYGLSIRQFQRIALYNREGD